jgi:hypothetical protein
VAGVDVVIIEIVIALAFTFFLLSIVASAVNELIAGVFKVRARMLEQGVASLLTGKRDPGEGEDDLVRRLFRHPLVVGYSRADGPPDVEVAPPAATPTPAKRRVQRTRYGAPSYLASRSFRNALLGLEEVGLLAATAARTTEGGSPADLHEITQARKRIADAIAAVPSKQLRETLQTIWLSVDEDAEAFRAGIERWFDRGMERVSGWYKRRTQWILWIIGGALAVGVNVNALSVADTLWRDAAVRDALVASVESGDAGPDDASTEASPITADDALDRLEASDLPIGWSGGNGPDDWGNAPASIAGWLLTAAAVSLGAPFWFDVLNKAANLRSAGKKPASTLPPPAA